MIGTKAQEPAKSHRSWNQVMLKVAVATLLLAALFTHNWLAGALIGLTFALSQLIFY